MQDSAPNIFRNLEDGIVDNVLMIRLGLKAKAFILQRVQRGEYLEGSTGGSEYSTTPMPVPYGLFVKKFGSALLKKKGGKDEKIIRGRGQKIITTAKSDEFSVFRSKSGKTMVLISGGYKRWRELNKKSSGPVAMTWTARMLRNLEILRTEKMTTQLGFSSSSENDKAYWQHQGAGKNKVTRKFMDLTEKEINQLGDLAEQLIIKKLYKSISS